MIKQFIGMITLAGLLLLVGQWDYEDEINAEKYYTESVCLWYATGGSDRTCLLYTSDAAAKRIV